MTSIFRSLSGLGLNWLVARCLSLLARLHLVSAPAATKIARRGFIRNATLGAVAIVSTQAVVGLIRFWWPNKTGAFGGTIPIAAASIPAPNDTPFQYAPGKFYIIHNDDGIMALYWKCPHLGCTVPWNPGEGDFHCPCHGSIYDYNGAKIDGLHGHYGRVKRRHQRRYGRCSYARFQLRTEPGDSVPVGIDVRRHK
jgi:cytochrome b6-f complex iron-sulfur subunit